MCFFDCCFEEYESLYNSDDEIDEQLEMIRRYAIFKKNQLLKEKEELDENKKNKKNKENKKYRIVYTRR